MYVRKTAVDSRTWNFGKVGLREQGKSGAPAHFSVYLEKLKRYGKCILNIKKCVLFFFTTFIPQTIISINV